MGKKRKRHKDSKAKPKDGKDDYRPPEPPHRATMTTFFVLVLSSIAAIALAVAGMLYGTQKIPSIWLVFAAIVCSALAACLHWQDLTVQNRDNPPFAAAIETALQGQTRDTTQIFFVYNQTYISPIPVVMYVRLVNLQDIPSTISDFEVTVQFEQARWWKRAKWIKTRPVPESVRLIWVNPPPTQSMTLDLLGGRLAPILEGRALQPHETVRGWVLLDVPKEFDSALRPHTFRLRIEDTAGKQASVITAGPQTGSTGATIPPRGLSIVAPFSIDNFTVQHWFPN